MLYVLDTGALIDAWRVDYFPQNFPMIWEDVDRLARSGSLTIPEAVHIEIKSQDDELHGWCNQRKEYLCTPINPAIEQLVHEIANQYPTLQANEMSGKNFADIYVIATAEYFHCTAVIHEQGSGNLHSPKMPDVCRARGIRLIRFPLIIREQGWSYNSVQTRRS